VCVKTYTQVLKASKTGAKGTHVRALMNPLSPGFDPKFKEAWDNLSKAERNVGFLYSVSIMLEKFNLVLLVVSVMCSHC